jgi:GNAT superfamily N-acetyltransferase
MKEVKKSEMCEITRLFSGIEDSMVTACIQGYMGKAYVDILPNPSVGLIVSGEYSFFAGDANLGAATQAAERLFELNPSNETICIFPDNDMEWESVLMNAAGNSPEVIPRYRIAQKDYMFDEELLGNYSTNIPDGYSIEMFDEGIYKQAMSASWSKEFCEIFDSADDYLTRGFGYAITCDGILVAGTSTMTVYDGGTEVQVATHPNHRRKGLAMASAAAFLLECQRRGIRACWDAAAQVSKKMAIALGYEYKGVYHTVRMKRDGDMGR